MDLSIVIPNYNTSDLIIECVHSIFKSEPKISFEIIVVDNGSTDNSVDKLMKVFGNKLTIIVNKTNKGFSKACNQGISRGSGKYKLLLNSDTLVLPYTLETLVKFAAKTKNLGVVGSQLLNKDKSIQPSCFRLPTITRTFKQYWLGRAGILDKFAPNTETPVEVEAVVGASFLITSKALELVGYLDERYFMYFEDLDYCRRVWKKGLKVYYFPLSKVIHHHGESGKDEADAQNQWRRLIPSSKIYHGIVKHSIITFIIWSKTKFQSIFKK